VDRSACEAENTVGPPAEQKLSSLSGSGVNTDRDLAAAEVAEVASAAEDTAGRSTAHFSSYWLN